jgi:hypothetical protein
MRNKVEDAMQSRHILMLIATLVLIAALVAGLNQTLRPSGAGAPVAVLENIRDYVPTATEGGPDYAVDSSGLYVGRPGQWTPIPTPDAVIASAVAVDTRPAGDETPGQAAGIYLGAANELAVYRTQDHGRTWLRVPLSGQIGGVTDLAFDPVQRLLLVGTDTAGLFRLRDVGSSLVNGGQLMLDAPVRQVVVDPHGSGLFVARTDWNLYRAEQFGLAWFVVEDLHSSPTALAMTGNPATVYVGTVDRGLLQSSDGLTWTTANAGLGIVPGSRLHVDTLAADPLQADVLYIATSFIYGTSEAHHTPSRVAVSSDGGVAWQTLGETPALAADLLPVSGRTGHVYVLTVASRTPQPLGETPTIAVAPPVEPQSGATGLLAWIIAGLAALALGFAVVSDLRSRRPVAVPEAALETQPIRNEPR